MRWIWLPAAVVIVLAVGWTIGALDDAYSSGPPYYGCTTNMDKWQSPWPSVGVAIGICIAIVVITRAVAGSREPRRS